MQNNSDVNLRETIHQKAVAHAEAAVYSLKNTYLSQEEKIEVELWFQLPGNVMLYTFVIAATWSVGGGSLSWREIVGIPVAVNLIVGLLNWYFYSKNFVYKLYLTVLHSWILYLVGFAGATFLFLKGAIALGIISLLAPFGLLAFFEPHLFLYPILAKKYRMHPKYVFFRRFYGYEFPFEKVIKNGVV